MLEIEIAENEAELEQYADPWIMHGIGLCSRDPHQHQRQRCAAAGKVPTHRLWQRTYPERTLRGVLARDVRRRLARHLASGCNVGLVIPQRVVVFDADSPEAAQRLAALLDALGLDAPFQVTGRGCHVVLRLPAGVVVRNTVRFELEPGLRVDVRGDGGQIVIAPSVHVGTGALYVWERALPSRIEDLPAIPQRWLEKIAGRRSTSAIATVETQNGELVVQAGCRNSYLYTVARSLRARRLSLQAVAAAVRAENLARCAPPLEESEITALLRNAAAQPDRADFRREARA